MLNELLFSLRERDEVAVLATDAYTLKEGLYICLNGDTYQELFIEKNKEYSGDLYEFIKARDFYKLIQVTGILFIFFYKQFLISVTIQTYV